VGTVSGVILNKDGGGALCANCTHPAPGQVRFLSNGTVKRIMTTAANGRFSVMLRPGHYLVQTFSPCDAPKTRIRVIPGQTVDLRLLCFDAIG
jgi:hypothetical protein